MKLPINFLLCLFIFSHTDTNAQKLTSYKGDYREGYGEFSYFGTWDEKIFHGKYLYIQKKAEPGKEVLTEKGEFDNGIMTGRWVYEDINYGASFMLQHGFNYYSVDGSKDINYKIVRTKEYKKGRLHGPSTYRWIDYSPTKGKPDTTTTKLISVNYKDDRPVGKFSYFKKYMLLGHTDYLSGELNDSGELDGRFHLEFTCDRTLVNDPECPNGRYVDDREYRGGILWKARVWNKNADRVIYQFRIDTAMFSTDSDQFDILLENYDLLKNHFYPTDNYSSIEEKVNEIEEWACSEIPSFFPFEIKGYKPIVAHFKRSTYKNLVDQEISAYYKVLQARKAVHRKEFNGDSLISILNGKGSNGSTQNILVKKSEEKFRNITQNAETAIGNINLYFESLTRFVAMDTNHVRSVASDIRKATLALSRLISLQSEFDSKFSGYLEKLQNDAAEFREIKDHEIPEFSYSPMVENKIHTQIKENATTSIKFFQSAFATTEIDSLIEMIRQHDEKRNMMSGNAKFLLSYLNGKQTAVQEYNLAGDGYCHPNISGRLKKILEDDYRKLAATPFYLYLPIDTNVFEFFSASVNNLLVLWDMESGIRQYNILYYDSPKDCSLLRKSGFLSLSSNNKIGINKALIRKIEKYIFEDIVNTEKENAESDMELLNAANLALKALNKKADYEEEHKKTIKDIEDRGALVSFLKSLKP